MDAATIKRRLAETGRSQRELAEALGLDPSAVTRLLKGQRRLRLEEAEKADAFFGDAPTANVIARPGGGDGDPDQAARTLPVYASAQGGPDGMVIDAEPIEMMRRPQFLEGVRDAFAFYVVGDSMEPRFRHGERLLVHPRRPPRAGEDVLIILKAAPDAEFNAMVKTLVAQAGQTIRVAQYNPPREFEIDRATVAGLHLIVGAYYYG
jgi:phage repressor protein C with HTH and peptisase S24 domain